MKKEDDLFYVKRTQRDYSLSFKLQVVSEVESEELSITGALRKYGMIKSTVDIEKLDKVSNNQLKKEIKASNTGDFIHEKRLNFKQDIDVRGMRGDEALQAVIYFIDDALQLGISRVRVLHGTGTGALR
jgi:DNA mismatch repair protein MutS2